MRACRLCGEACGGSLCGECLGELKGAAPGPVCCVGCGEELRTGWVSIKGRCADCHENREAFADYLEAV